VPYALRPWQNQYIADFSKCCSSDKPSTDGSGKRKPTFFTLMRALFGYQAKPTRLEIIMYCSYWFVIISGLAYKIVRGTIWGTSVATAEGPEEDEATAAAVAFKGGDAEAGDADGKAPADAAATEAPQAEEKEVLFSSLVARILLRLTAACTKPDAEEPAQLAGVAVDEAAPAAAETAHAAADALAPDDKPCVTA
jgi:hypothetical protein